jgi:hypothetical protein
MKGELVQVAIAGLTAMGGIGGIVAFLKLRPEAYSAAVTQAQGAMDTMQRLNVELDKALEEERESKSRWKRRAIAAELLLRDNGIAIPILPHVDGQLYND